MYYICNAKEIIYNTNAIFFILLYTMATVTTTIRVEKDLKDQATKLAKSMGLTFNIVMNNYLKRFVEEKEITFSDSDRKTVVDFGESGMSATELLSSYEQEYGEKMA